MARLRKRAQGSGVAWYGGHLEGLGIQAKEALSGPSAQDFKGLDSGWGRK